MRFERFSKVFLITGAIFTCFFIFALYFSFNNHITDEQVETTNLPSLHIKTENLEKIKSREKYIKGNYSIGNQSGKCKIRGRGNSTWEMTKKPYLLKFDEEAPFLDMPKAKKWVLMANGGDNTNLRNAYATYLAENVFHHFKWTPHYRFVNLFINGRYEGLYQVYEKIEASESRLNIPDPGANFHLNGSVIMVTDTRDKKPVYFVSSKGIRFAFYSPREVSEEMKNYLVEGLNKFESLLFGDDFADPEKGYRKYIDEDAFVDWYLINEFTKNRDARFRDSCYLYYDPSDGLMDMGPIWDFDISCGNNSYPENSGVEGYWIKTEAAWYKRLMEDPYFYNKVVARWNQKQDELLKSFDDIYALSRQIKNASELDDKAWRKIGHYQWPHAVGWQKRRTYDAEVDYFMNWIKSRREWINEDLKRNQK